MNIVANLLSGVGGVVLGFVLSLVATGWQEGWKKREQKEAVFMLLRIEIDQNLAALEEYQKKATTNLPLDTYEKNYEMRKRYLDNLPQWRHQRWESLTPLLAATLKEQEIKKVDDFHATLDELTIRRSKQESLLPQDLVALYEARQALPPAQRPALFTSSTLQPYDEAISKYFHDQLQLWQAYQEIIASLLEAQNPLEAPTPASASPKLFARLKGRLPGKRHHKQP